jgi:putrescine aminotransferase
VEGTEVLQALGRYMNPGLMRSFSFFGLDGVEVDGLGSWVKDHRGERYLDLSSGYGVHILGYRHPKVVEAVMEQLRHGLCLGSRVLLSEPAVRLAERLAQRTPGDLEMSFFVNSGAEAVEAALKFARMATGRPGLVAAVGAFHGKTLGALSVSGRPVYREPFQPLLPGVTHVPYGDVARLKEAVTKDTAAVILEPIQGEGGVVVPPPGYLRAARDITQAQGALLILDEVQTGLGRTGWWWACQAEDVVPDYLCLAKGLGGGILPVGAVVGRREALAFWDAHPLIHTSTFGGGPLAATAALAALEVLEEENLPFRAAQLGETVGQRLQALAQAYPQVVAQVRGRGLMWGLEATGRGVAAMVMSRLFTRHVLAVYTLNNERVLRFLPALTIPEEDLEWGLGQLEEAVAETAPLADELLASEEELASSHA